jgi:hypothetical protein
LADACGTLFEGQETAIVGAVLSALLGEWLRHYDATAHQSLMALHIATAQRWIDTRDELERRTRRTRERAPA